MSKIKKVKQRVMSLPEIQRMYFARRQPILDKIAQKMKG